MLQGQLCTVLLQYIPPARAETCGYIQSYLRMDISIHSTREGGDGRSGKGCKREGEFQSTPPAKAETHEPAAAWNRMEISIHSTREGGDNCRTI